MGLPIVETPGPCPCLGCEQIEQFVGIERTRAASESSKNYELQVAFRNVILGARRKRAFLAVRFLLPGQPCSLHNAITQLLVRLIIARFGNM